MTIIMLALTLESLIAVHMVHALLLTGVKIAR